MTQFLKEQIRDQCIVANVIDELFEMYESYLEDHGLEARGAQIIVTTLAPILKQGNSCK